MSRLYPVDHPLGSACLKVKRANVHINALYRSLRRSALDPKITFRKKGKLHMPSNIPGVVVESPDIYEMEVIPSVRESWGPIVGDILSNLRASLDHIAWALALKYSRDKGITLTKPQEKSVYFPLRIEEHDKPFLGGLPKSALQFFPPNAWDAVERVQPYNRKKRPELEVLAILSDLTNEDKHRVVTPVFREASVKLAGEHAVTWRLNQPDKMMFLVTDSVAAKAGYHLEPKASFDLVLHVPFLWPDYFKVSDFRLIHNLIRDEVIPAFACFFPEPQ